MLVFYGLVPGYLYWAWGSIMGVLTAALAYLGFTYKKNASSNQDAAQRYGLYHSIVVGSIGLSWGIGALYATGLSDALALYYTFVLGGTALGAVSSQHSLLRSCMLSIWTSIPPLAVGLAAFGPEGIGWPMAWLVCLFGVTLSIIAVRMNRFLTKSVAMALSLDGKVAELTELSKELDIARTKAEESERSKSQLLAQASHDMRHPVHAIGLMAEVLRLRLTNPDNLQAIDRIEQSVESLAQLFRSLLDMSALELGKVSKTISKAPLNSVLKSVVSQFAEAEQSGQLRRVSCSTWVETDPALLRTIVQNLVSNALKYGNGAEVLVGCRRRNGKISVEVHDLGPGIRQEDQERIFESFIRLTPQDLGGGEGLGLGLSIVKRMAALLGLSIRLQSIPDKGTCFAIDGLMPAQPVEKAGQRKQKQGKPLLETLQIALIEPDDTARSHLAALIGRWGCSVKTYSILPEMLEAVDAILLGEAVVRERKSLADLQNLDPRIQVAIMTGLTAPLPTLPSSVQLLKKPVVPMQLRSLLLTTAMKLQNTSESFHVQKY